MNITVIIPTYARPASMLQEAIESVPPDDDGVTFEIVVVDDGSPDPIDVEDIRDHRARLVLRENNGGVAAAQNTGLDHAAGDAIVFLHTDDTLVAARFGVQASVLEQHPEVGWVGSRACDAGLDRDDPMASATTADMLWRPLGVHISNYLFRRDVVARSRFDEELRCREDWDLLYRLKRSNVTMASIDVLGSRRPGAAPNRLSNTPEMAHAMVHLRSKYWHDLRRDRRVLALWELRTAQLYESFPDAALRRQAALWYARSLRHDPLHPQRAAVAIRAVTRGLRG